MKLLLCIMTLLMIVTRFPFGQGALHLMDASWALFFLLGRFQVSNRMKLAGFAWFVVLGWVIDLVATGGNFVSSYCMTPAYAGMPIAYGVLCLAGMASRGHIDAPNYQLVVRLVVLLALGVFGAFVVSNAFFYQFSGYFDQMSVIEFARSVIQYFPSYVLTAQLYILGWFALDQKYHLESQVFGHVVAKAGAHE